MNATVQDLRARVRYLEKALAGFQQWTGVCTGSGGQIAALYSNVLDVGTGVFTLTFASQAGQKFQVQQSTDGGVTWTVAENVVNAAADPAIQTVWESGPIDPMEESIIFRVRRYPQVLLPCPTPDAGPCPNLI